jgi:SecD/SecF fusion protein
MKNLGSQFALILVVTLLGVVGVLRYGLKPGIDLSGGTILVYQIKPDEDGKTANVADVITSLKRRLNPDGVRDITIRQSGSDRVEIVLPDATAEEVEDAKRKITNVGALEFRILASRKDDKRMMDTLERDTNTKRLPEVTSKYGWARVGEEVTGANPQFVRNTLTDTGQDWQRNAFSNENTTLEVVGKALDATGKAGASQQEVRRAYKIVGNTSNTLTLDKDIDLASVSSYTITFKPDSSIPLGSNSTEPEAPYVREEQRGPGHKVYWILVKKDRYDVEGRYIRSARQEMDQNMQNAVGFTFDRTGARKFGALTSEFRPQEGGSFKYRLAILLDGTLMSAPSLNDVIKERGIISGGQDGFSSKEIDYLVSLLRSGSLPATIDPNPLFEESIGPTLGEDTIYKGIRSIFIAMILVPIFMIIYYRIPGVISVVAMLLNVVLILGSMALFQSTFTLPGLAGLALTIGMAVDANILIFERMREEKDRGAALSQQIRMGFGKAWMTILDTHVTTILSGVVLYWVGSEEVRGFAVTLIIGLLWNLFTAVFVSRIIFEWMLSKRWVREISMMRMFHKTNYPFTAWRRACMLGSLILIGAGLLACFARDRGWGMLNIDFTGGTLVSFRLKDSNSDLGHLSGEEKEKVGEYVAMEGSRRVAFVREQASILPDVTVETLSVAQANKAGDEKKANAGGFRYNVRTTEQDIEKVQKTIIDQFGPLLARAELKAAEPKPIAAAKPAEGEEAAAPARFAGGLSYDLSLSIPQPPSKIKDLFLRLLEARGEDGRAVENPEQRFQVARTKGEAGDAPDSPTTKVTLETNLPREVADAKIAALASTIPNDSSILFDRVTKFGGAVAADTQFQAIYAIVASWVIIALYLWLRFKNLLWGIAAIIALVHDVLVTLGFVAVTYWLSQVPVVSSLLQIEPLKIDLPMVAAFLTLIGFSVNDTIVVFDRIREIKGKSPLLTAGMIDTAVNQTLSRTILTTLTALIVAVIMYFFGGEGLHGLSYCLVVGMVAGTYSSIFIAAPILLEFMPRSQKEAATKATATALS